MSEKNPEVTFDEAAYRLLVLQRELEYHKAVYAAASTGMDESLDIYNDVGDHCGDTMGHVSTWMQRVSLASEAVAEVSAQVAHAARIVAELTRGAPTNETLI